MSRFRPFQAQSVGLILHYECTNRCAHCLYACRPGLEEEIRLEDYDRLLDSLEQGCAGALVHIGGGEPFLRPDRLLHVLRGLRGRRLALEYVETNGFWVRRDGARALLESAREAGCPCLLLSISPFHNAFLSCRHNEEAYRMIVDVFGPQGIFPWHPAYYPYLRQVDPDRTVPFEEYVRRFPAREIERQLAAIIYLHPAGRAAASFAGILARHPPERYLRKNCRQELSSAVHAHVDPHGRYLAGFCSGLQVGDREAFRLEALFREGIDLAGHPVLEMLILGTLADLYRHVASQGFRPDPKGYVSACHLCGHLRAFFFRSLPPEQRPLELAPAFFYEEMGPLFGL